MSRPYEHHHGRQSIDAYISMLPVRLAKAARRHRTSDWSMLHVYSIPQALRAAIDYNAISEEEKDLWRRVHDHYVKKTPMPTVPYSHLGEVLNKITVKVSPQMSLMEMVRIVFQAVDFEICSEDVIDVLTRSGIIVDGQKVCYTISRLMIRGEVKSLGYKDRRSKKGRFLKYYIWIEKKMKIGGRPRKKKKVRQQSLV